MEIDDIAENVLKDNRMDVESEEGELSDDDADITLAEPLKKPEIPEIRVFCPLVCIIFELMKFIIIILPRFCPHGSGEIFSYSILMLPFFRLLS